MQGNKLWRGIVGRDIIVKGDSWFEKLTMTGAFYGSTDIPLQYLTL